MEVPLISELACCPLLASIPRLVSTSTAFISTPHLWSTWAHRKEWWKCSGHLIKCISLRLTRGNRLISPRAPASHWRLPTITESNQLHSLAAWNISFSTLLTPTWFWDSSLQINTPPTAGPADVLDSQGVFLLDSVARANMPNWWVSVAMNCLRTTSFFFFSRICEQVWFYTLLSPCVWFLETRESCDRRRRR